MIPFAATPIGKAISSIPEYFRNKDIDDVIMGGILLMLCSMLAFMLLLLVIGAIGAMFGVGFMVEETVAACEACGQTCQACLEKSQ